MRRPHKPPWSSVRTAESDRTHPPDLRAGGDTLARLQEQDSTADADRLRSCAQNHLLPALGGKKIHAVNEDDIARLIRQLEPTLGPWAIRGQVLTPLSGIFRYAVRQGWRSENPVRGLEADEKPTIETREQRILEPEEIRKLLEAAPTKYRPLIETAVFTGLRLGELLGLKWGDVDLSRGVIRVHGN
jgi:integrase